MGLGPGDGFGVGIWGQGYTFWGPGNAFGVGFRAQGIILGWALGPKRWFWDWLWGPEDVFDVFLGAHEIRCNCVNAQLLNS